jgi:putative N6-adenine-specific DNA methylase
MERIELIATAAFGLEAVVAKELKDLGYTDQMVENGRVTFLGDQSAICRTNMWLRSAERVLIKVGEFEAKSFEELFEKTKALPWDDWIPQEGLFPVEGKSIKSMLASVPDCQAIVKKAVVEKLKQKYKINWFEETGAKYRIEVGLLKDRATLTIDTSGEGLHKRGYRKLVGRAPLKETMASAMILLSYWRHDRVLWDPFCGTGTIPIEAAFIGLNMAPGIKRSFVSEDWKNIPREFWQESRAEAKDKMVLDRTLRIQGTDIDGEAISLARYHAKVAGVEQYIHFQERALKDLSSRFKHGIIITNPPYGERLEDENTVLQLYEEMGQIFKTLEDWSYYVITSQMDFEKFFGKKAEKKRKVYNGRIQCNYYQFYGAKPNARKEKGQEV